MSFSFLEYLFFILEISFAYYANKESGDVIDSSTKNSKNANSRTSFEILKLLFFKPGFCGTVYDIIAYIISIIQKRNKTFQKGKRLSSFWKTV